MRRPILPLFLLLLTASFAHAQVKWSPSDQQQLNTFKLTLERVNQVDNAMEAFARRLETDPAYKAKIKRLDDIESGKVEPTPEEAAELERQEQEEAEDGSLAGMERKIEREPKLAAMIKSAGMTPREFVLTEMALFQAMFAHTMKKQGYLKELPKEVPAEHVAFVAAHEKEIEALTKKWQAISKQMEK